MRKWLFLPALLLIGCSTVHQQLNPNIFYMRDMSIGDVSGAVVLPKAAAYHIEGRAKGNLDLFTLTSCHREFSAERQGHSFQYDYTPVAGIEDQGSCSLSLGGFDRKGRHSWAFIDFESDDITLPAVNKCNGVVSPVNGASVCQSRAGNIEEIDFDVDVDVIPSAACPLGNVGHGKIFKYILNIGECVYDFMETAPPRREHKHTTLGYQEILLHEE